MKNSTFLALSTALVLALTVGCRNTAPKTTPLPGAGSTIGDGTGSSRPRTAPDLNTNPSLSGSGISGTGITGGSLGTAGIGELPDDDRLADRNQDRTRFAAQTVYFDFDRSNVRPSDASHVQEVASQFKALPAGHDLLVEGHCDERGTEEYNRALGERRALAIRELLISLGVDPQRVFTKSFGKDNPAVIGHDDAAYSKNRRGEFILVLPKN